MPPRKKRTPKTISPVDPHNADDRVVDLAFNVQIKELAKQRKWSELEAAFVLHGSTLTRREESWSTRSV